MDLIKLKEEQIRLARKVELEDGFSEIQYVGGLDMAYVGDEIICQIVVMEAESLKVVDQANEIRVPAMKYVPGYLSYRESPLIVDAFTKLTTKPDLLFVKGNGIIHPRGLGLASHVGLLLDMPTIGVAKKLLLGKEDRNIIEIDGKHVGFAFSTREHAKPIYISPGHLVSLESTEALTKRFCIGSKLPEPMHVAHRFATKLKRPLKKPGPESDSKK